ncbi:hypothetical protein DIURU_001030 [Diutina rugosa]|uniref:Vta1 C-terminal domain-containing protein n=1 Tax=Diutina rugosa TaxID=5481 RepID=A0A642UVE8_DIURU|nr:uncharacterized protein DIURU_001030 [Diutina rugosa]KAA8906452.1 hypothetical protein DIURU_001030 [Diutina rugosa]
MESLPPSLQTDKNIAPYIARANEVAGVNPAVSYYCLIYVLEYILNNKLHTTSKEVEAYTVSLLDETESLKSSEELKDILGNKQLSLTAVVSFAYKLFNQCVQDKGTTNKAALISKIRATINFLTILSVFTNNEGIDWEKISGGKAHTGAEFDAMNRKKIKILKVQLMKVVKSQDAEMEEELEQMIDKTPEDASEAPAENSTVDDSHETVAKSSVQPPKFIDNDDDDNDDNDDGNLKLPDTPQDNDESKPSISLPGAPRNNPDESENSPHLPSAPDYLPDEEIPAPKSSAIHVIHRESPKPSRPEAERRPSFVPSPAPSAPPVTKETVQTIVDRTEALASIQKHAKFAISALNYEDTDTAKRELEEALAKLNAL